MPLQYSPEVIRRFGAAGLSGAPADGPLARGEAGSLESGTWVVFTARIINSELAGLDFRVYGCPHTVAACSLAADWLLTGPASRLGAVDVMALREVLDIPPEKTGRLLIIQDALRNCLADWENSALRDSP